MVRRTNPARRTFGSTSPARARQGGTGRARELGGEREIVLDDVDLTAASGRAVLIRTDHSTHWGTPAYFESHPALGADAANRLVDAGVACVGIDSLNIDATEGTGERPVHTTLLGHEIPIVEHLTNLGALPTDGFTFTAVPPKIAGAGTFTVRAYATLG